ncbi:hypothetical protein ONV78_16285 [Hahella sp. CR1]|uniref:hypothetical protein n=1 Tax=Hahella sp. CR1 TaxID=2992807 RepID=UPI0024421BCA|nr:hypothetical protein [Hahella sp. CR1]MDG9669301.1 hypothetical protein [Hahella sp. CR1]
MESLPEILKENELVVSIVSIVFIFGALVRLISSIYEMKEEHFFRRKLKRVDDLISSSELNSLHSEFLRKIKETQIFSLATGLVTSPRKSEALMKFYMDGNISARQIKWFADFFDLNDRDELVVSVSLFDEFGAYYSLFASGSVIGLSAILAIAIGSSLNIVAIGVGFVAFVIGAGIGILLAMDYVKFKRFVYVCHQLGLPDMKARWYKPISFGGQYQQG